MAGKRIDVYPLDEAMSRLDAFLALNEPELPKLVIAMVLIQRGTEISMECGVSRKSLVESVGELWTRTREAAARGAVSGGGHGRQED